MTRWDPWDDTLYIYRSMDADDFSYGKYILLVFGG